MNARLRVLILEDRRADAELIAFTLRRAGYTLDWVQVDNEADYLAQLDPPPDVVLADLSLPTYNGMAALEAIRARGMDVPFIVVTGTLSDEEAVECIKRGASDYLLKDRLGRLGSAVQRAIDEAHVRAARRQAETALRESEWRLSQFMAALPVGVFVTDEAGRPLYANRTAEELLGQNIAPDITAEQIPEHYGTYVAGTEQHYPMERQPLVRALRGEASMVDNIEVRRADRTVPLEVWGSPVTDESGAVRYAIAALVDISARRAAEEALRQSEERLRQAQKMEAIGLLAGGIAHDFNNLLTAIMGFSQLLQLQLPDDSPMQSLAGEILSAGERASNLTRQLLAFGRKQLLSPEVLDLNEIVFDMGTMLRRIIGENIDLVTILAPDLKTVRVDRGQMEQVIVNLAVNARDAMPNGGKLTLETANVELDEEYIRSHGTERFGIAHPAEYVRLAISDNGIGMDAETQARVFEPFFTTKEPGRGTGLGLSTVYGIVKQSGGDIWVYSEPGAGTTFKIYFPITDAAGNNPTPKRGAPPTTGTETILLVEDEPGVRSLSSMVLEKSGYRVLAAGSAEEALATAEACPDEIHLLITDLMLPGVPGRELAQRLTDLRPGLKTLFVSGYTADVTVRHGILESRVAFLQKPFTPSGLTRKVREILDGE